MPLRYTRLLGISFVTALAYSSNSYGQTPFTLGWPLEFTGIVPVGTTKTIVNLDNPYTLDGQVTTASFGWSAAPCSAAVKIKFFRMGFVVPGKVAYFFQTERGPFDVQSNSSAPGQPVTQTVALNPPVPVHRGDAIGITNIGTCGGPMYARTPPGVSGETSVDIPGDYSLDIIQQLEPGSLGVAVQASGLSSELGLLGNRFVVSLAATNSRTAIQTIGTSNRVSDAAGYFSLPDFTGDPTFPEVVVKMVDATGSPALGGDLWFFHAPLTDVPYTLTVTDQRSDAVRTYSNTSGSSGQLCGAVDTSAFSGAVTAATRKKPDGRLKT